MPESKKQPIAALNELRGLAAIYIVFSHIPAASVLGISLGNYGVGIFYLLSAFLTLYNAKPGAINFLKKRALRIIPLYWVITLFTFIICLVKPDWFNTTQASFVNLAKSLFFIPYTSIVDGAPIVRPILDVGWTLTLEVIFYLIFALAMTISYKYKELITVCTLVVSYIALIFIPGDFALKTYRDWIPYFIIGIFVYMAWPSVLFRKISENSAKKRIPALASAILKVLIIVSSAKFFGHFENPAVIFVVFSLFIILDIFSSSTRLLSAIGAASYELYLTHEFIVKGFSRLVYPLDEKSLVTAFFTIILTIIAISIAIGIHKLVNLLLSSLSKESHT